MRLADGDKLTIEGVALDVIYTPGHTDNSYSFMMADRVFTGDTLLIRGTGRTDFQNGDARMQYEFDLRQTAAPARRHAGLSRARLQRRHRLHHRRGEALQSAPAGQIDRRIRRADGEPQSAEPEDDGRRGAGQHEGRTGAGGDRAARLGADADKAIGMVGRPDVALIDLREQSERDSTAAFPARCTRPIRLAGEHRRRRHAARTRARNRQAHPVLLRLRRALGDGGAGRARRRAHRRAAISRAASTPGRKPAARWSV